MFAHSRRYGDTIDSDGDGAPNACDDCPLDSPDDTDLDGACDSDDVCEGTFVGDVCSGDDTLDADLDGVPDDCDICAGTVSRAGPVAPPFLLFGAPAVRQITGSETGRRNSFGELMDLGGRVTRI